MYIDNVLGMGVYCIGYGCIIILYWVWVYILGMGVYCIGYGCILYWVWVYIDIGYGCIIDIVLGMGV